MPELSQPGGMGRRLHLGCGRVIKQGWVNHDRLALPGVDVVHDLREFPWPFADAEFDEVFMKDVLEHLTDTVRTMDELYRITRPGATVFLTVPYWNSYAAVGDPTHVRLFSETSFDFFDPRNPQCIERSYYSKARFHVEKMGFAITPFEPAFRLPLLTRDYVIFNPFAKRFVLGLASVFCNVINGLEVWLRRVPDEAGSAA